MTGIGNNNDGQHTPPASEHSISPPHMGIGLDTATQTAADTVHEAAQSLREKGVATLTIDYKKSRALRRVLKSARSIDLTDLTFD